MEWYSIHGRRIASRTQRVQSPAVAPYLFFVFYNSNAVVVVARIGLIIDLAVTIIWNSCANAQFGTIKTVAQAIIRQSNSHCFKPTVCECCEYEFASKTGVGRRVCVCLWTNAHTARGFYTLGSLLRPFVIRASPNCYSIQLKIWKSNETHSVFVELLLALIVLWVEWDYNNSYFSFDRNFSPDAQRIGSQCCSANQ